MKRCPDCGGTGKLHTPSGHEFVCHMCDGLGRLSFVPPIRVTYNGDTYEIRDGEGELIAECMHGIAADYIAEALLRELPAISEEEMGEEARHA